MYSLCSSIREMSGEDHRPARRKEQRWKKSTLWLELCLSLYVQGAMVCNEVSALLIFPFYTKKELNEGKVTLRLDFLAIPAHVVTGNKICIWERWGKPSIPIFFFEINLDLDLFINLKTFHLIAKIESIVRWFTIYLLLLDTFSGATRLLTGTPRGNTRTASSTGQWPTGGTRTFKSPTAIWGRQSEERGRTGILFRRPPKQDWKCLFQLQARI